MKKLFLLSLFYTAICFGQDVSLPMKKVLSPLFLIDGKISNEQQMKYLTSVEIASVSVYKSDNLPKNLQPFTNFFESGIIDINLKKPEYTSTFVSLQSLNKKNNLDEINPVYVNGILVTDTAVKIFNDAIIKTEIIENKEQKFLNIRTVEPEQESVRTESAHLRKNVNNDNNISVNGRK